MVFRLVAAIGVTLVLVGCATPEPQAEKVPVFLLLQADPDRLTLEAIVPVSLVQRAGGVESLSAQLGQMQEKMVMVQFGKPVAEFLPRQRRVVDTFGAIAIFKLDRPFQQNRVLTQQGIMVIPQNQTELLPTHTPSYQYNCPSQVQNLVLQEGQAVFLELGVTQGDVARTAISSIVCVDVDGDQLPEIVAGLRLDNPDRPLANDVAGWQKFLGLPPAQRQEYSALILLRGTQGTWHRETIIGHSRTLTYVNDTISSYVLDNAHDLDGDRRLELMVREISLTSIYVWIITPNLDPATITAQPWLDYYLPDRSLTIRE